MRFQLLEGRHATEGSTGKVYKKGDVVESDVDLLALFGATKFAKLADLEPKTDAQRNAVAAAAAAGASGLAPNDGPVAPSTPVTGLGTDVTAQFPAAEEAQLAVFEKNKLYFVAKAATPAEALNEEPLKKAQVVPFIKGLKE